MGTTITGLDTFATIPAGGVFVLLCVAAPSQGCALDVRPVPGADEQLTTQAGGDPCAEATGYSVTPAPGADALQINAGGDANAPGHLERKSVADARCGGPATHVSGRTTDWGAQINTTFPDPYFDATSYDGISFWVKQGTSGQAILAYVTETHTDDSGGNKTYCDSNAPDNSGKCDAFIAGIGLTTEWRFVAVPFGQMNQKGFGVHAPFFDAAHIHGVGFQVTAGDWDFWIDDLAFYRAPAP